MPANCPDNKNTIIEALEQLTREPGFVYTLAIVLRRDFFLDPSDAADLDWHNRLSFQEVSFLVGLMVKTRIDLSVTPTEQQALEQTTKVYELFERLHQAHYRPFFDALKQDVGKEFTVAEAESSHRDLFGSGQLMTEPIFYGGSGAYDFQYWEFAPRKYKKDHEWIEKNKGFSLDEGVEIAARIKRVIEDKGRKFPEMTTFDALCKETLSLFCFDHQDLSGYRKETVDNFIAAFCATPGAVNQELNSLGAYNTANSHPIVVLDTETYFLPVSFNLAQSLYESPFYWMNTDKDYLDIAAQHRGEASEEIAGEILATVFDKKNVYRNVKVYGNKGNLRTDIDLLAIAGNKAIVFQSKSKKLTELSKMGIEESLRSDFREAVQDAYEQGLVCRKAIIDKKNKLVKANGEELVLDESIDDAYIVCLTSDHYPAVAHQLDVFLKKQAEDPDPLAMSILDLDILAFYLRDPFEFLYYVNQRVKFTEHFKAESEMALLGFHLSQKLFPSENVNATLIDEGFAQLIDANFPAAKGHQPSTAAAQRLRSKWSNETFERLIEQIKNTRQPGLTDALYRMYDLAGKGADDLVRWMVEVKRRALQDKQSHDFSTVFRGEWGFSFLCLPNSAIKPNERLAALARARKYKSKSNEWLAFGSLADSPNMVDSIAYSKEPWKPDSELEELTRTILKVGEVRGVDGKKLGRNQPCVCGSGKKFKRCCL